MKASSPYFQEGGAGPGISWLHWAWIALVGLISLPLEIPWMMRAGLAGVLFVSYRAGERELFRAGLLFLMLFLGPVIYPRVIWQIPTAPFVLAILVASTGSMLFTRKGASLDWLRRGELDAASILLVVATSLVSGAALLLWASWTDNLGAGAGMVKELEGIPPYFLLLVGVPVFAVLNALAEELVYRGFLQDSLERIFGERAVPVLILQASAFASAHYFSGFPNGKTGYAMTFIYAVALGHLKRRTGGMLAPFLAHVVADLVIGFTLVALALA